MRKSDQVNFVLLPPSKIDQVSDLEDKDDDIQVLNDPSSHMPTDVAEEIEVVCEFDDDHTNKPDRDNDDDHNIETSSTSKKKQGNPKRRKKLKPIFTPNWSKAKKVSFSRQPVNNENKQISDIGIREIW